MTWFWKRKKKDNTIETFRDYLDKVMLRVDLIEEDINRLRGRMNRRTTKKEEPEEKKEADPVTHDGFDEIRGLDKKMKKKGIDIELGI